LVTKSTKETRRFTEKTYPDKHFCGLSNLKSIGSDTRKTKHAKTFLQQIQDMLYFVLFVTQKHSVLENNDGHEVTDNPQPGTSHM